MIETEKEILESLKRIEESLSNKKRLLTFEEARVFLGISSSFMYKLTSKNLIPHYKPSGKLIYFTEKDLIEWATSNKNT